MDRRPIGVFDSGLGGLTAVRQLLELLPAEDIVYFGDTGRVPYGTRGTAVIQRYAKEDCRFLLQQDVKLIIAACGTVSSVAPQVLSSLPVPAIGVVEPTAAAAVAATHSGKIGIIGTSATVRSGSFAQAVQALRPDAEIFAAACPLFVPLVENGWIDRDDPVTRLTVARYLEPLRARGIDTLILGCTHFPLLIPLLQDFFGDSVSLIDAGREAANACARLLQEKHALNPVKKAGDCRFYVTDRPDNFTEVAEMFLGRAVQSDVHVIDCQSLPSL